MDEINALSDEAFVARFGFLFEHSPWVVERAAGLRPFASRDAMQAGLIAAFDTAPDDARLAVLRAHPRLADKVAVAAGLTRDSAAEQASAGLDSLTPDEFTRFHDLNAAYDARFGFPFIICVRLAGGKACILRAMEARLGNAADDELITASNEVAKIVTLRLRDEVVA